MLSKIIGLCVLLICAAEGIYYWSFSKPAYSTVELYDGYRNLMNAAIDKPTLFGVTALHQSTEDTRSLSSLSASSVMVQTNVGDPSSPNSGNEL